MARRSGEESVPAESYYLARGSVLAAEAEDFPRGGVLVLGDSIVERQYIAHLCGRPVLNAGISGITAGRMSEVAPPIVAAADPALVVVAVGVNNAIVWRATSAVIAQRSLEALLTGLRGRTLILVGIQPVEPNRAVPRPHEPWSMYGVAQVRAMMPDLARRFGASYVPPLAATGNRTADGIHLTPAAAAEWQAAVERACPPA